MPGSTVRPPAYQLLADELRAEITSGRLVSVLDGFAAPPNGIYAVFPQRKHLPLRVRLWIDFLKRTYGERGYWSLSAAGSI